MSKGRISHIGIAVADLESAIDSFSKLTGDNSPLIEEVTADKVRVAIFGNDGGRIELLSATADDSPVAKFIQKRGEGLHHICFYVDDIDARLNELKDAGFRLIDETCRTGAEGKKIAFIHPKSMNGVLVELEERTD